MDHVLEKTTMNTFQKTLNALCITPLGFFALVLLLLVPVIPPFNQEYLIRWMVVGLFMAAQAVAFDFTGGYINIVNFGFAAFVGLGAYTSGILCAKLGLSPWIGMFVGIIPAGLVGFLTGILTLRLRGIFAAVMAWFIGLAIWGLAIKLVFLTEGPLGLNCPTLLETSSNLPYFYIIFAMFIITYVILKRVVRSNMGLAFTAIGQNMDAARTSGINPVRYRIINFTLSCAFAGWLGGFYAHYYGILMPEIMHTTKTVEVLVIVYIGGRASLWGGAAVAIPFVVAMELVRSEFSDYPGLHFIFYGLFLILIMIYYPGGFAHLYETLTDRFRKPSS
ncbi:MAG: branched-chain amino acid ABC transporter permease [Desulfobacterales bacterium]|nr:branched-chain amino acid ABC transporter permease [Desulfobacterales bacterium]